MEAEYTAALRYAAAHLRSDFVKHVLVDRAHRSGVGMGKSGVKTETRRHAHQFRGIALV